MDGNQIEPKMSKKFRVTKKHLCQVCNIFIDTSCMEQHLKGKKHLSLSNQMFANERIATQIAHEGIIVHGILPHIRSDKLVCHFKKFGQVVAFQRYGDNRGLLQFKRRMQAELALKGTHEVDGCLLTTQPRSVNMSPSHTKLQGKKNQVEVLKKAIEEAIKSSPGLSLDEQLRLLTSVLEMTERTSNRRLQIISSLEEWLSLEFPGCQLHMFGSSSSGLAFEGESDLDICLEIPALISKKITPLGSEQATPLHEEVTSDHIRNNESKILRQISNILRTHPDISGIFVVSAARVPVSKFVHAPSGTICDLTCNNIAGVQNSKLLHCLQNFDSRIRPFLFALKLWAKCQHLIGSPESTLSSYGLNLLAVFYLQQLKPPLLPSIEYLQDKVTAENRIYCHGWNISFYVPSGNNTSISEQVVDSDSTSFSLLAGFFQFYRKFKLNEAVICPQLGKALSTTDFLHLFPSPLLLSPFKFSELSVQDPFELNFNVTFNFRHSELFYSLCESAENVCLKALNDSEKINNESLLLFQSPPKKPSFLKSSLCITLRLLPLNAKSSQNDCRTVCQSIGEFIGSLFTVAYGIHVDETASIQNKRKRIDEEFTKNDSQDMIIKWEQKYLITVPTNVCQSNRDEVYGSIATDNCKTLSIESLLSYEKAITDMLPVVNPSENKPFAVMQLLMRYDLLSQAIAIEIEKCKKTPLSNFTAFTKDLTRCLGRTIDRFLVIRKFDYQVLTS